MEHVQLCGIHLNKRGQKSKRLNKSNYWNTGLTAPCVTDHQVHKYVLNSRNLCITIIFIEINKRETNTLTNIGNI